MSRYTHALTCIIPAPLGPIGAAVGRALDPDTGGDKTFVPMESDPSRLWVCACPITAEYAQALPELLKYPAALLGVIELDFAARFPDVPLPTLAECEAFCAAADVSVSGVTL